MSRIATVLALTSCSAAIAGAAQQQPPSQALLSPAHSCTFCGKDRAGPNVLKASFILWQAKEWGLEFGSKSFAASDPDSTNQTFHQKLYIPDFSWSPGFKIDFGTTLPHDGWDWNSRWTFYHGDCTNLKKHLDMQIEPSGYGIVPLWHYPFIDIADSTPLRFQNGAANWKLFFNSFDLDFGRAFQTTRPLFFRLLAGAKGSWIRQRYHVEYTDGANILATIQPALSGTVRYLTSKTVHESEAWGLGPKGGVSSQWKLGYGFSLTAESAFSCLCSYLHTTTKYHDIFFSELLAQNETDNLKMKEHFWELIPLFEGLIGFDWGHCFGKPNNPIYFGLSIAYELQYWWSQNRARRNFAFQSPGNMWDMRGDLQMQGLTLSIRSDF